jgi:hypothetical protein
MASEKFLKKLFLKLTKTDFDKDEFLTAFYKLYKKLKSTGLFKSKTTGLFKCYIDYIIRNKEFSSDDEKTAALTELYNDIRDHILYKDENASTDAGFVTETEREESNKRHGEAAETLAAEKAVKQKEPKEVPVSQDVPEAKKGPIKFNKAKALRILSMFIKQSSIITYEDPTEISNEHDETFREFTQADIVDGILNFDGRELPKPQPDVEFGKRSDMMNIWRNTESKCKELCEDPVLDMLVSKVFFIDTQLLTGPFTHLTTVTMKEINELLPVETFEPSYSRNKYQTVIRLVNTLPLDETVIRAKQRIKTLYICAGSQMVQGGNADQGLDVQESMLYMTSSYSIGISKALHAYPLSTKQLLLCTNVLVFKDTKYQELPMNKYQRIAVMCCPNKWRPSICNTSIGETDDTRAIIYDPRTIYKNEKDYVSIAKSFANALETALFFDYDTIVLDDRAIEDNQAPAHLMAKMMKDVIGTFNGRFREIVIAINKAASFNVFRHYFSVL